MFVRRHGFSWRVRHRCRRVGEGARSSSSAARRTQRLHPNRTDETPSVPEKSIFRDVRLGRAPSSRVDSIRGIGPSRDVGVFVGRAPCGCGQHLPGLAWPTERADGDADAACVVLAEVGDALVEVDIPAVNAADPLLFVVDGIRRTGLPAGTRSPGTDTMRRGRESHRGCTSPG